jgi:hypothetical protein
MTLADIDKALAQWESRLSSAAHNLFDLQADPTYQCLTGTGGAPLTKLSGVTQAKVAPALENIGTLFQCFDLLRCTVDRAVQVRRDMPSLFGADQKAREIEQLLTGRSIRIPADQIPMAKRSLLTGADDQGCISPGELLTSMEKAFVTARDGVMAVDHAWRELGVTLGDASRKIAALRSGPEKLEEAEIRELEGIEQSLSLRRAQVQCDPLGTSLDIDTVIRPAVDRLTAALEQRVTLRGQTEMALIAAQGNLRELRRLYSDASAAWVEACEKISGSGELPAPPPETQINSLGEWLARLQEKYDDGMVRPVSIGLQNWNSAARTCVCDVKKVCEANRAPLELRKELRGRINALKAKAQAYRVEEDADLRALASEAEALLYTRPTPMDRACAAVTQYQARLQESTAGKPGGKTAG